MEDYLVASGLMKVTDSEKQQKDALLEFGKLEEFDLITKDLKEVVVK
jgi:DeoR/GlpR family transcriptional regulator of sugar metabolism